jgi:L,D-transpeptidase-like protein
MEGKLDPPDSGAVCSNLRALALSLLAAVTFAAAPAPAASADEYLVARPLAGSKLEIRDRPGGRIVARVGRWTRFGSPLTLGVVRARGEWLGVTTPLRPNGQLGWVRSDRVLAWSTRLSLVLDRSARRLYLRVGNNVRRAMVVGVGRPESPTPLGRFAVTDKLLSSASYYGCCVLALSASQPHVPRGWNGGSRVAIHGTNRPSTIGTDSSAGCPHASEPDLRYLLDVVPLGTPVFIRA